MESRKEFLELIIDLDFPFNEDKNSNHQYLCMWTQIIDRSTDEYFQSIGIDKSIFVRKKLKQFNNLVSVLAHEKDDDNNTVLSIASYKIKEIFYEYMYFYSRYEFQPGPPIYKSTTALVVLATEHKIVNHVYESKFNKFKNPDGFMTEESFNECFNTWNLSEEALIRDTLSKDRKKDDSCDFNDCDIDKCGKIGIKTFIVYCSKIFGETRKVVLKFMKNDLQYRKEIDTRVLNKLDSKHVLNIIIQEEGSNIEAKENAITDALQSSTHKHLYNNGYRYMIVMRAADRSLEDIIKKEKPDNRLKRILLYEIAQAIKHLHSREVLHGDIKSLNIVRIEENGKTYVKIIDLDASMDFKKNACTKFSSGILPPEIFVTLNESEKAQFDRYIRQIAGDNDKLYEKMAPIYDAKRRCYYGLRVFDEHVSKIFAESLGKDFYVKASPAIDVWSFGVLMFYMLSTNNETLFPVDINDDLSRQDSYHFRKVVEITDEKIKDLVNKTTVYDDYARNLLTQILKRNPADRPSFTEILVKCILSIYIIYHLSRNVSLCFLSYLSLLFRIIHIFTQNMERKMNYCVLFME